MQYIKNQLNELVDRLLETLDEDICYVHVSLERLNRLRKAVIKREETSLKEMIELIQNDRMNYRHIENRRIELRKRIASLLGMNHDQVNMTRLCEIIEEPRRGLLKEKQKELNETVPKFRAEHTSTILLLRECARFNGLLLKAVLGDRQETSTYNSGGDVATHRSGERFVSFRV